jgi:hypothetical protein
VPKNIYLSNKCLLAESSKEYMHAFCNWTCLLEGWEEKACTKLHNRILWQVKGEKLPKFLDKNCSNFFTLIVDIELR